MKKLFIIAALAILADVAMAQTQEKVLYILNGEVASKASVDSLPSGSIRDMNVIKGVEQVVVVNTRDYVI
jgi:outer membrane protein assembly factor BamE (lipoprotein component of BamABCDE complex)